MKGRCLPSHLLFIAVDAFAHGWTMYTTRLLDTAAGLGALGWDPTLLAAEAHAPELARGPEAAFPGRVIRVPWASRLSRWAFRRLWWELTDRWRARQDPGQGWASRAPYWYRGSRFYVPPDVIWAISWGNFPSMVAAHNLSRLTGCPWVLELHDPCPLPGETLNLYEEKALQECLDSCAALVTTTHALAVELTAQHACLRGKTHTLYTSFDETLPRGRFAREPGSPLRLLHAGTLYGGSGRSARALIEAMALAFREEPAARGQIHLELLGAGKGAEESEKLAEIAGVPEAVAVTPQVQPSEAVAAMDRADVLVLIKYPDTSHNLQVPGKTFPYLGRGKPILGLMVECEAAELLRRSGLGLMVGPEEVPALADQLLDLWRQRDELSRAFVPDWDYISQFSRSRTAERINALLRGLLG
jgi:glycosyltransferase involved in cell wall biosynthesis